MGIQRKGKVEETIRQGWARLTGARSDPFTFVVSQMEYLRAAIAVLSIITLHILFFCLNFDTAIWPLFDISLLANITFTFGLFIALGLYCIRLVPFVISVISMTIVGFHLAIVTWMRVGTSNSLHSQKSFMAEAAERVFKNYGISGFPFELLMAFYSIPVFPSRAAIQIAKRRQQLFLERFSKLSTFIGYLAAVIVLCYLYSGFQILPYLLAILYAAIFIIVSSIPDRRERENSISIIGSSEPFETKV